MWGEEWGRCMPYGSVLGCGATTHFLPHFPTSLPSPHSPHLSLHLPHTPTHFPTPSLIPLPTFPLPSPTPQHIFLLFPHLPSPSQSTAKLPCDEVSVAKLPCGEVTGNCFDPSSNFRMCSAWEIRDLALFASEKLSLVDHS